MSGCLVKASRIVRFGNQGLGDIKLLRFGSVAVHKHTRCLSQGPIFPKCYSHRVATCGIQTFSSSRFLHSFTTMSLSNPRVTLTPCSLTSLRLFSDRSDTKALTVWSDLKQIKSSPLPALVLGFSGLVPFVSAPLFMIMWSTYLPWVVFAHTAYGAAILSFLGGVRWGFTLPEESLVPPDWTSLSYSVVPSLIGWGALLCPAPVSTLTVMTGLAGLAYFDSTMYGYPPWFKGLRFVLSLFAVLSLWTTFVCGFLLDKKASNKTELNAESVKDL